MKRTNPPQYQETDYMMPNKAPHSIRVPKEIYLIEQLEKEGKYIPNEIMELNKSLNEYDIKNIPDLFIILMRKHNRRYYRSITKSKYLNVIIFQCNTCSKRFTISINKRTLEKYIMTEIFDKDIHSEEKGLEIHRNENEYFKACQNFALIPPHGKIMETTTLETINNSDLKYLNKFESNIKYSIIKYISVLELHNKKNMKCSIDKNEGFNTNSNQSVTVINQITIILPYRKKK